MEGLKETSICHVRAFRGEIYSGISRAEAAEGADTGIVMRAAGGLLQNQGGNDEDMSMAVIGILPIVIIYPFVQKYFVKGVVVGAVKG